MFKGLLLTLIDIMVDISSHRYFITDVKWHDLQVRIIMASWLFKAACRTVDMLLFTFRGKLSRMDDLLLSQPSSQSLANNVLNMDLYINGPIVFENAVLLITGNMIWVSHQYKCGAHFMMQWKSSRFSHHLKRSIIRYVNAIC